MAFKTSRSAVSLSRQALRRCRNQNATSLARPLSSTCSRPFATSEASSSDLPRWNHTPERMKAPFSPRIPKDPSRSHWVVNEDPKKLDDALNNFLGRDGEKMLPEELKWLAVTHKSFDQARRGFNDRLAFLGRQICTMEAVQSIISTPTDYDALEADPFADKREPIEDAALRSVDNLSKMQPNDIFTVRNMTKLAIDTGLSEVVRWKPRIPENPKGSGLNIVMSGAIYAIIGAVALQNGGKTAHRIVRERIVKKLRL